MLNILDMKTIKVIHVMKVVSATLTKDIYFDDELGRPIMILKNSIIVVDLINLIAWAPDSHIECGVHFTIEKHEFRVLN